MIPAPIPSSASRPQRLRRKLREYYETAGAHDLREIARLGAGTIVEGTVRKAGSVLRISVTIVDSETRQAKWSQVFDRKVRDLFAIENEIARSTADTLWIKLASSARKDMSHQASSAEAHVLYLKGRQP